MTESKRLQFTTLNSSSKGDRHKQRSPTIRLQLCLKNADTDSFNEFSFTDLVRTHRENLGITPNGAFLEDEDSEQLKNVARAFELKYGTKTKAVRRSRIRDLVDLGDGYDETDTFIDNSEAYDEVVPDALTTKYGGFYINSGQLEFREVNESNSVSHDVTLSNQNKKRVRKSLRDSDSDSDIFQKTGTKKKVKNVLEKSRIRLIKKHNRTKSDGKFHKTKIGNKKKKTHSVTPDVIPKPLVEVTPIEPELVIPSTPELSLPVAQHENLTPLSASTCPVIQSPVSIPALPAGLSQGLQDRVEEIKEIARATKEQKGKGKFFTDTVNKLLLEIVKELTTLRTGLRGLVYSHLASHLPCSRDTLVKRCKMLLPPERNTPTANQTDSSKSVDDPSSAKETGLIRKRMLLVAENEKQTATELDALKHEINQLKDPTMLRQSSLKDLLSSTVQCHLKRFEILKKKYSREDVMRFITDRILPLSPEQHFTSYVMEQCPHLLLALSQDKNYTSAQRKSSGVGKRMKVSNKVLSSTNSAPVMDILSDSLYTTSNIQNQTRSNLEAIIPSTSGIFSSTKSPTGYSSVLTSAVTTVNSAISQETSANSLQRTLYDNVKISPRKDGIVPSSGKAATSPGVIRGDMFDSDDLTLAMLKSLAQSTGQGKSDSRQKRPYDNDVKYKTKHSKLNSSTKLPKTDGNIASLDEFRKFGDNAPISVVKDNLTSVKHSHTALTGSQISAVNIVSGKTSVIYTSGVNSLLYPSNVSMKPSHKGPNTKVVDSHKKMKLSTINETSKYNDTIIKATVASPQPSMMAERELYYNHIRDPSRPKQHMPSLLYPPMKSTLSYSPPKLYSANLSLAQNATSPKAFQPISTQHSNRLTNWNVTGHRLSPLANHRNLGDYYHDPVGRPHVSPPQSQWNTGSAMVLPGVSSPSHHQFRLPFTVSSLLGSNCDVQSDPVLQAAPIAHSGSPYPLSMQYHRSPLPPSLGNVRPAHCHPSTPPHSHLPPAPP